MEKVDLGEKKEKVKGKSTPQKEKKDKVDVGNSKEKKGKLEEVEVKKVKKRQRTPIKETQGEITGKRRTRADRTTRKIECSTALKMAAFMINSKITTKESIRVQSEDLLFGHKSFTFVSWHDFEVVFTMDELTGPIIDTYTMCLYEKIKNGTEKDHGFCFVNNSSISACGQTSKNTHAENASRYISKRLSNRKDNFVVIPYNPGGHWVLAVVDMNTSTCYYLDSLRPSQVPESFKQIIDATMMLYATQTNLSKRHVLNWINRVCPR